MFKVYKMNIRRAEFKDIKQLIKMLSQVLELHAKIRPDVFASGTTKYSENDLQKMIEDKDNYIYVATDDNDMAIAYAFCEIKSPKFSSTNVPHKYFYIDDFCVDENHQRNHIGKILFEYVIKKAKELGCYEIILTCWEGNNVARKFYGKMGMKVRSATMELLVK